MSGGESQARVAFVTGAASGIGKATARRLAAAGVRLCLADRDEAGLRALHEALRGEGADVMTSAVDVRDREQIEHAVAAVMARFGRIDALANIAGGAGERHLHQIDEFEDEDWDHVIALNLTSTFLICRSVVPVMRAQGYGRIVNMASTIAKGKSGPVGTAGGRLAYAAAKSGILGLTHQLAKDLAASGITVNVVLPWLTLGEPGSRIRERFENLTDERRAALVRDAPTGRAAETHEVAAAIEFLLSESAGYVSGVELPVDGAFLTG